MLAAYDSVCQRCPEPILRGQAIVRHRGGYIHRHCASGQDDE
jgi:hypothetical protein